MYAEHFGLRELPFSLTPDTSYFLDWASAREALNLLVFALRSGEGFVKVVGEVGTGKTLLCRSLLARLPDEFVSAFLPNPFLTPSGLRLALAEELGVEAPEAQDPNRLVNRISARLLELAAAGRRAVLLLDEAQALPDASLETVRLLSNLETERTKLLQVILFGQPELDQRLAAPGLRQLRQRIAFSARLRPLDREELAQYVGHRLRVAGHPDGRLLARGALTALHDGSSGIPRLVNVLCHKALLVAFGLGHRRLRRRHVRRAIRDTESARRQRPLVRGLARERWA